MEREIWREVQKRHKEYISIMAKERKKGQKDERVEKYVRECQKKGDR